MSKANTQTAAHPLAARRVFLYARVSTEEQARNGQSIETQLANLQEWAKQQGHSVVGVYIDSGVSARKPATKRPELQKLLAELKEKRAELIVFTKLDRWFRNVKEYYKVQEILDAHGVAWQAIQEDYETVTATGRFKVNIMLAVAEDEADRTSERIKVVFENKVTKGEVITGKTPLGYRIENKRLVPDEQSDTARAIFRYYMEHQSVNSTMRYARDSLGVSLHQHTITWMLKNTIYIGMYRGNPNYCEPLIPQAQFDAVQEMLSQRSVKRTPTGRVYIFSGLIFCADCGHAMSGRYGGSRIDHRGELTGYAYYRCNHSATYHDCVHSRAIAEMKFEKWLLENVSAKFADYRANWIMASAKKKAPKIDRAAILRKLDKLKELYVNDLITMDQYRADYDRYNAELLKAASEPVDPTPDFDKISKLLSGDLSAAYSKLEPELRRSFWRSFIEKIEIDRDNTPTIFFKNFGTKVQ